MHLCQCKTVQSNNKAIVVKNKMTFNYMYWAYPIETRNSSGDKIAKHDLMI